MLIPELYTSQLSAQSPGGPSGVRAWTVGQILEATVVRQALDGTVTLRIGGQEMQARTGLALAADQPLTLQVAQSGTQVVLRVLHASNSSVLPQPEQARTAMTPEQTVLARAWRQVLPRAGALQPLLTETARLLTPSTSGAPLLPPALMQTVVRLQASLPHPETLGTSAGLKQALADSGIFLEAKLAQALLTPTHTPSVASDLKANLLQLVAQLRTLAGLAADGTNRAAPMEPPAMETPAALPLLRHAEAALSRIEHNQLTMVNGSEDANPTALIADLPVREAGGQSVLQLRIEQDGAGGGDRDPAGHPWSVWLHFDFEALGAVQARVTLTGDAVSVGLWAERPATAALFNDHLAELDGALRQAGLVTGELHCETGRPVAPAPPPAPDHLLDERA